MSKTDRALLLVGAALLVFAAILYFGWGDQPASRLYRRNGCMIEFSCSWGDGFSPPAILPWAFYGGIASVGIALLRMLVGGKKKD